MRLVTYDDGKVGRVEGDEIVRLDVSTMRNFAPWAPLNNPTWVDVISSRLTGYVHTPVYGMDITTLKAK